MQVNFIQATDVNAFNALAYPEQHWKNDLYFRNEVNNLSQTLTETGRRFMEGAREVYDRFANSAAVQAAKSTINRAVGFFNQQTISPLSSLEELQGASVVMQRWVMAEPTVRELYNRNLCDGYTDSYLDVEPGRIRDRHYDYRRATQGLVKEDDEGTMTVNHYFDELKEGDRELTFIEQKTVASTWHYIKMQMKAKVDAEIQDPTNPMGGIVGVF